MQYVIWGAGLRGKRLFSHLRDNNVLAFVDKNEKKIGTYCCGKKIISLQDYVEQYKNAILVIAHVFEEEAIEELDLLGINRYMLLSDCPGELQGDSSSLFLKEYIKSIVRSDVCYGIWGCTVYGLELYSWLAEWGNDQVYLIIENNAKPQIVCLLKQNGYRVMTEDEVSPCRIGCILNCKRSEKIGECIYDGIEQRDIYDCADMIPQYYNPGIERLKDINKGKRCVIVATGPSLRIEDLDKLASVDILTFGVNNIGSAYGTTQWRPTYYVGIDRSLIESEYFQTVKPEEQSRYSFISDLSECYWKEPHKENVLKVHPCNIWPVHWYPKFSEDVSRKVYIGGTVVYISIQIAVYLGFEEIYLLGTDFTGSNGYARKYRHFYTEKQLDSVCYSEQVRFGYGKAKQYADTHGIKIYNATRGGELEIFERVNFDELF